MDSLTKQSEEPKRWENGDLVGEEPTSMQSTGIFLPGNLKYLLGGFIFGIVLIKSEVVSWFRIQEMFRLQSFHMYGVIGSAVITGIISVWLLKKLKMKTIEGSEINIQPKKFSKGQIIGGFSFGLGWALTGACPGPIYAQIGAGFMVTFVTLLSALAGVWIYGRFRHKLPH